MSEENREAVLAFLPMQSKDLPAVLAIETVSHIHPWTQGNFADSLAAGHWAYCIYPQPESDDDGVPKDFDYLNPLTLWAYCILYPAVDELHLLNITVSPNLRNLGIGKRIMHTVETVAGEQGMSRILLEVRPSNLGALKLYALLGYEQIGVRKQYYPADSISGMREDALVMVKSIKLMT
jgi:ribosomal-protein-alanine N-acetyltransferase